MKLQQSYISQWSKLKLCNITLLIFFLVSCNLVISEELNINNILTTITPRLDVGNPNQLTMTVSSDFTVKRLFVRFYQSDAGNCSGFNIISLDTSSSAASQTLHPGITYYTNDAFWYAFCNQAGGQCNNAFNNVTSLKIQWVNASGSFIGNSVCYGTRLQNSGGTACSNSTDCGFSAAESTWVAN